MKKGTSTSHNSCCCPILSLLIVISLILCPLSTINLKALAQAPPLNIPRAELSADYGSELLSLGNSGNYTLIMAVMGSGNVTPSIGSHVYTDGSTVNVTATPASGWQFFYWTGDVADPNLATTSVTMDGNKTVTANFVALIRTFSVGWDIDTVDSTGDVGEFVSLALDSSNNPHVAYFDNTNLDLKYACWDDSNWVIQTVPDSESGTSGQLPSIALDSSNRPHISYSYAESPYPGQLKYAHWNGSNWQISTVDSAASYANALDLDSYDYPHIAYRDDHGSKGETLSYARWDGSSWQIQIIDNGEMVRCNPSLAIDNSDSPHISYHDDATEDLKYAYWNGSNWQFQTVDSNGRAGEHSSLALDSFGNPHISYSYLNGSNNDTAIKYAYWDGSSWQIQTVDSEPGGIPFALDNQNSLALDSFGNPHISYYDERSGDLKYAYWDGSSWQIGIVDSEGDVGSFNSLAVDSNLKHIAYYDKTQGDLKHAYMTKMTLYMMIDGSGNVTPTVGLHSYPLDSTVNITATPAINWEFVDWTGDVTDANSATTNITMDTNKVARANFHRVNSVLKVTVSGNGNVIPTAGSHAYPIGTTVNMTAIPASGWQFSSWTGGVSDNTSASTNVTLNWDKTVTAFFTPAEAPSVKWWLVLIIATVCIALIALLLYLTWWRKRRIL